MMGFDIICGEGFGVELFNRLLEREILIDQAIDFVDICINQSTY